MKVWSLVALIALWALPLSQSHSLEFEPLEIGGGEHVLFAKGPIRLGDDERLHRLVAQLPRGSRVTHIVLNSPGGNLYEAASLAQTVRNSRLITVVALNDTCASACFLVFAAGVERIASEGARIGVHSASDDGNDNLLAQAFTTLFAREAAAYGVPASIVGRLVVTPPNGMTWLTHSDLRQMGTEIVPNLPTAGSGYQRGAALSPGAAPSTPTPRPAAPSQPSAPAPRPAPPREAIVPPEQTAGESQAFIDGLTERTVWEVWITELRPSARAGAEHWASQRSLARPAPCHGGSADFAEACEHAKRYLTPSDVRRRSEPEYRRGWNAFIPHAYRASVLQTFRQCRADGLTPALGRNFETVRDYNNDGLPDYVLDYGAFRCGERVSEYCGSGGCRIEIYLSTPSGYRQAYAGNVRGFEIVAGANPALSLALHGSHCGQAGAFDCRARLIWNGSRFAQ